MDDYLFFINTIFNFSFITLVIYGLLVKTRLIEYGFSKWGRLFIGLFFAALAIVSSAASYFVFDGLSLDGRLVMILLATILYGLETGFVTLFSVTVFQLFLGNGFAPMSALIAAVSIIIIYVYKGYQKKRNPYKALSVIDIYILGFLSMGVFTIWVVFTQPNSSYLKLFYDHLFLSIIMVCNLLGLLYYLVNTEQKNRQRIDELQLTKSDLQEQNMEIRALYEQMAATEEALQENFDELNEYRWQLEESEKRYQRVLAASEEGFFDYYPITKVWFISEQLCEILEFDSSEREEVMRRFFELVEDEYKSIEIYFVVKDVWRRDEILSREIKMRTKQGKSKWVLIRALAEFDSSGKLFRITGSILDINQRKLEEEKVAFYAFHNPITGFLNEDYFMDTIKKYYYPSVDPLMVMYVGIYDMYQIERVYGRKILDLIQYQVGLEISKVFEGFSINAQIKKGVFGIIILEKEKNRSTVNAAINALNSAFSEPLMVQNYKIEIELVYPFHLYERDLTEDEMIERLNVTLEYCNTTHQVNHLVGFQWDFYNQKTYLKQLSFYLSEAISEKRFEVVYQPQYQYTQDHIKIIGFEALVRLKHQHYGYISPEVFIPLAEEMGIVNRIDLQVLEKACALGKAIENEHSDITMSVNVSFLDLLTQNYFEEMTETIKAFDFSPSHLIVEVTETAISQYIDAVMDNLERFSEMAIEVHLDDFGTGYSSIGHLGQLNASALKIDRSFVDGMLASEKMQNLIKLIIQMGHQLDMKIIAEGIENQEQLDFLNALGCDYYQGYYLSKPISAEEVMALLSH